MANETQKNDSHEEKEELIYELGYLIVPTVPEDALAAEAAKVRDAVEKFGAVSSSSDPAMRALAYEMEKKTEAKTLRYSSAYFGHMIFRARPSDAEPLKKTLEAIPSVLRFLIIRRTPASIAYQASAPSRPRREEKKEEVDEKKLDETIKELVAE